MIAAQHALSPAAAGAALGDAGLHSENQWELGATLPFHHHPEIEQSWVLEGSFYDHDGICRAGQFVWRAPGSMHETHTDEGCTLLAIYRKPNVFYKTAGFEPKG